MNRKVATFLGYPHYSKSGKKIFTCFVLKYLYNKINLKKTIMKIELKYDGKNYYDPIFILFWNNEKNKFVIGICHNNMKNYDFIIDDIQNNFEKYSNIEQKIMYYTKNNVYVFDLKDNFNLLPINQNFEHSVALLNENDKIIEKEYRVFETIINEDTTK